MRQSRQMPDELSPSEAAKRLGATTRSVQRWIVLGRLPARRVGGRWRVASDALDAFERSNGAGANAATAPAIPQQAGAAAGSVDTLAVSRAIRRLFIANRGEIARRIRRTCDRLGIEAIEPLTDGPRAVDLLDIKALVDAALAADADAVHPGFGFLAENADFAAAVEAAGITWVGPPPDALRLGGDKLTAKRIAA